MNTQQLYELYKAHPVITTDSRDCPAGSIFLALKGASFNGNRFARAALQQGCAYAIVDEADDLPADERIIVVDDALQTFKLLAREHRRQFSIPVIGITGTNGKTTTKELVRAVLAQRYRVLATEGNFNNDVGVPKTLFRLTADHEIAIIEMGASHPGDIRTLVETAEPTCGLITNVGRAHLQGFGSFEGVKRTKGELYDFLATRPEALTFVNADSADLTDMAAARRLTRLCRYTSHQQEGADVEGRLVACDPLLRFEWRTTGTGGTAPSDWHAVDSQLVGAYNLDNMLAAISAGLHFGVSPEAIGRALQGYVPTNNRSQLTRTAHNQLVVDAYNANPTSMAAAVSNFRLMQVAPKMAILGMMGELGDASQEEHQRLADMLATAGFEQVWLVGGEFARTDTRFRVFADVEAVKQEIALHQPQGMTILIKGSHSTRLYELPPLL